MREKSEEIFVWGACDKNGDNWIFQNKPALYDEGWDNHKIEEAAGMEMRASDCFPKDKPQKYKLVPVDE